MKYRTKRDIIIPAGTEVTTDPPHKTEFMTERATVMIEVTRDITAEWHMDLEEGLEAGVVEEAE